MQQRKIDQFGSPFLSLLHGWDSHQRLDFQLLNRPLGLNAERADFARRVATKNGKGQQDG